MSNQIQTITVGSFGANLVLTVIVLLALLLFHVLYFIVMAPKKGTLEWIAMAEPKTFARRQLPEMGNYRWLVLPGCALIGLAKPLYLWNLTFPAIPYWLLLAMFGGIAAYCLSGSAASACLSAAAAVILLDAVPSAVLFMAGVVLLLFSFCKGAWYRRCFRFLLALGILTVACCLTDKGLEFPAGYVFYLPALSELRPMLPGISLLLCLLQGLRLRASGYLMAFLPLFAALACVPILGWGCVSFAAFLAFSVPVGDGIRRGAVVETSITAALILFYDFMITEAYL